MKHRSLCLLAGLVVGAAAGSCWGEGRSQKGGPAKSTVYKKWPFDAAEAKRRQAETAKALGVKVEQDFELAPGVKITMVLVPAGEFLMGSAASAAEVARLSNMEEAKAECFEHEHPQHRVTIREPVWLGKHEVTQAQWEAVTGSNPSEFKGAKNPVERVSWNHIQQFLKKVNARRRGAQFRLPTEAQREYACRAGTQTPFHFGETISTSQVNYDGNYPYGGAAKDECRERTRPVATFPANAWGLHDMHGNVFEWCQDRYGPYEAGKQTDPTGPATGQSRVLRGGSWLSRASHCRSAYRFYGAPASRYGDIGFRVARPLP